MDIYYADASGYAVIENLPSNYTYVASSSGSGSASGSGSGSGSSSASGTSSGSGASSTVVASALASTGAYNFVSCAVEPFQNGAGAVRAFNNGISTSNNTAMTVEYCANYCSGYNYFGVEYGDECYCGNSFNAGVTQDTTGGCSMACAGNAAEQCKHKSIAPLHKISLTKHQVVALVVSTSTSSAACQL